MNDAIRRIMRLGNGLLALILLVTMLPLAASPAQAVSPGDVVISEIRIDQPSTDNDEYFELVAAAGTALDGLTYLVIGDGTGGSGVIEAVVDLTAQSVPASGYFVAAESTLTLGTADLVTALNFENDDNVTHLLVSDFIGANGDDLDTDDDGTLDVTPWAEVLDLIALIKEDNPPSGTEYHYGPPTVGPDGTYVPGHVFRCPDGWQLGLFDPTGGDDTPGAANACVVPTVEVVVNEIMQNPAAVADSAGEWFELYNPTDSDIDIDGWTIADNDIDSHVINNGGPLVIPAGGYLVLGNNTDQGTNGGVPVAYSYGSNWFLANGADEVILLDTGLNEIDRVEYDDGATFPDPNGASMSLVDPALDNNVGANWCTASTPFGAGDLGTPGSENDCVVSTVEVVINEIMQNPSAVADAAGEWFELFNATGSDIDINGWTIADNDIDSHVINNGGPLVIPAGGYLVLGNNTDQGTNGGVPVAYSYGSNWFLANGADEVILLDTGLNEIDRVEYDGGPNFPDPNGASMSLRDPALDNNVGANWCTSATPFGSGDLGTPGAANVCSNIGVCGEPAGYAVWEIQGNGETSPLVGMPAIIEGVVVGDFQNNDQPDDGDLNGFYVQEEDGQADGDVTTSDGIFVYAPAAPDVSTGDLVRVGGVVAEYETSGGASSLTELSNVGEVLDCGSAPAVPAPTNVTLPVDNVGDFERYEGMLVTFPQSLYISEYYNFDRFGEIVLTTERQFQPTATFEPGSAEAAALSDLNLRSRITLDDGRGSQNPDPAIHPDGNVFDLTNLFRGGDIAQNATGVIDETFGLYRIQPTQGAVYTPANPRTPQPDDVGGNLKVASLNVLNYFTTIDDSGPICGPLQDQGCRGADTPEEFTRQRDKIIAALAAMDADVVGLIEIENHPGDVPTADLVSGLNAAMGAGTYAYIATGAIGTDVIRQAFLYKPSTVSLVGGYAILDDPSFTDPLGYGEEQSRPALAQTFMDNSTGGVFTVVVNHLKSKSSACGDGDDDPEQGNCNLTRALGAQALVDWLATDPTGSGDGDFLIIGDLNSYDKEDPIDVLVTGGYTDLLFNLLGENAYSYVFDGQLGYLDYALANPDLLDEVTGVTAWHINADEPDILDYDMTFKQDAQDALYEPNAYRSSDHDPIIAGLDVCDEIPPTLEVSVSPDSLWPPNHKYVEVTAEVAFSDNFDQNPTLELVSVESNEPDAGLDEEDLPNDIEIVNDFTFRLRAERWDEGDGRIYTITYRVTDACGNWTEASATVTVPHDLGVEGE